MQSLLTGLLQEVISGIAIGCIYSLIALGFTLIYKASEVINFAQGELMMVGAYINFFLITFFMAESGNLTGWNFFIAFVGSILFAIIFGWVLDRIINKPLKDEPVFSVIMATISLSIILRAIVSMIAGPMSIIPLSPFGNHIISVGGVVISILDTSIIVCAIFLVIMFYYFFHKTRWGIAIQATSEDTVAAQLMGIPIKRVYTLVWIFSAIVATLSGILLAPRMSLLDTSMGFLGLKAFPAAVLGGFGSILGAIVGGLILGVVETISIGTLSFYFPFIKEINDIIVWIVLIAVLMIKPDGLFGVEKVNKV